MDRLLAVLAHLISQRSFREECVSEAASGEPDAADGRLRRRCGISAADQRVD